MVHGLGHLGAVIIQKAIHPESHRKHQRNKGEEIEKIVGDESKCLRVDRFFLQRMLAPSSRSHPDQFSSFLVSLLTLLSESMQRHFYEGYRHGEDHPDVDHLDVRSHRQSLSEAQKTEKDFKNCQI